MTDVLVAFASKRGSTQEIAEAVADGLRSRGLSVDCRPVEEVREVSPYGAVVLGSAVYIKRWRGDAKRFLRRHRKALAAMPFWVFSSGPVGDPEKQPGPSWLEPPKIVKAVERLGARDHVVFGGRLPAEPKGPMERSMVDGTPEEYRDRRDWDEIRAWASTIASSLDVAKQAT
ncbi:MAG: flavodoxin [Acidimicrobiia bacterium]|nr:flavodoxin [Acidimicrobiia bacterium]